MINIRKTALVLCVGSLLWIAGGVCSSAPALNSGNAERGEQIYVQCAACHSPDRNRTGPKHCGLIGRKAGTVEGFDYSLAMQASGVIWDAEAIDNFLLAPLDYIPGTKMGLAGIKNTSDRFDLIAYLIVMSDQQDCE